MEKILTFLFCLSSIFPAFAQTVQTKLAAKLDAQFADRDAEYGQLEFNANEDSFFALADGRKLTVWATSDRARKFSLDGKFTYADFSPDGRKLAVFTKNSVAIVDAENGKTLANINQNKDEIRFLAWSPNSRDLALAVKDFTVGIFDVETGKIKNSVVVHQKKKGFFARLNDGAEPFFIQAAFTPDGSEILTSCHDATAELWNVETGKIVYTFTLKPESPYGYAKPELPEIYYAEISPNGKWILIGSYGQNRLWETATGKLAAEFSGYSHPSFSPDNRYLGMITDPAAKERATALFDLSTLEIKTISDKYHGGIVAWSSDGSQFITDRTTDEMSKDLAYIWDADSGKQKASLKTYSKGCFDFVSTCISDFDRFSFQPNGKILMSQSKKRVKLLNPENGSEILSLNGALSPAVWSPKGNFILAKDAERGKIALWEVIAK